MTSCCSASCRTLPSHRKTDVRSGRNAHACGQALVYECPGQDRGISLGTERSEDNDNIACTSDQNTIFSHVGRNL